ncbi:MAG TPA: RAMP superfamily CRISPR-associated protein [Ktedonobacteraceae bacterium]|nr:RAMP superfamily CRISPR-associated protein [Ktedonobacteraceae bacterium]
MATKTDRIRIEYDLTFESLWHCGTGIREVLIDRTVMRDSEQYLYVPGSTFKGVLREHCEHLARFFASNGEPIASPHDAEAALLTIGSTRPDMITRIFGSQTSPGQLFFDDARHQEQSSLAQHNPEKDDYRGKGTYRGIQVMPYTQVRMNRPTRTAVPGALYTSEFGASELVFKGVIQGWLTCNAILADAHAVFEQAEQNGFMPTYSFLLLLAGLRLIERLGGNKSTGKGKCLCKITRVELNGTECGEKTWLAWLEQIDVLDKYNHHNQSSEG